MGITLSSWKQGKGFAQHLAKKAQDGTKVRILLMHQDNPALPELINLLILEENLGSIRRMIIEMYQFFSDISNSNPGIQVKQILHGCPHFQLTRNDDRAVLIQYLYSEKTGYSPLWSCAQGSSLYANATAEFNALWTVNSPSQASTGGSDAPKVPDPHPARSAGG